MLSSCKWLTYLPLPDEINMKQVAYSNILGCTLLSLVASKLVTLFSTKEGTFLRRNLLLIYGAMDIFLAGRSLMFEKEFHTAGATTKGLSFITLLEGTAFLYDAVFRERKVKASPTDGPKKQ